MTLTPAPHAMPGAAGAALPAAAVGGAPHPAPPMGQSPAAGPTPNAGMEVKGIQAAHAITNAMAMTIPLVGPTSDLGKALAKAMMDIGKHIPPGMASPEGERNELVAQLMRNHQMATQQAALRARAAQAAMQGEPGAVPHPGVPAPAAA